MTDRKERKIISPCSKPQELFLSIRDGYDSGGRYSTPKGEEVDIVFYGGGLRLRSKLL